MTKKLWQFGQKIKDNKVFKLFVDKCLKSQQKTYLSCIAIVFGDKQNGRFKKLFLCWKHSTAILHLCRARSEKNSTWVHVATSNRVPTRYWTYWKSIEFQNCFSRPWKSIERYGNSK